MTDIQIIGAVVASGLFSGAIASIVSHISATKISKAEREFNFEKEEYRNLQQKAEDMFGYIHFNDKILDSMLTQLQNHVALWQEFTPNEEVKKYKQKIFEMIHVHFFDLSEQYNNYVLSLSKCMDIYFECAKTGEMSKENAENLTAYVPEVREKQHVLIKVILDFLKKQRGKLVKN